MNNCEQNLDNCLVENNFIDNSYTDYSEVNNITKEYSGFIYLPTYYNTVISKTTSIYNNSSFDTVIGFIIILFCLVFFI